MAISPTTEAKIKSDLYQGAEVQATAKKYGVGRTSVYRINNKMQEEAMNKKVHQVRQATPEALELVVEKVRETAPLTDNPRQAEVIKAEVAAVISGAQSLNLLELEFHTTFNKVLTRANAMLDNENLNIIDWQIITNTLAGAFKEVFHQSTTTINNMALGDNVGSQTSLSMFQGRMKS